MAVHFKAGGRKDVYLPKEYRKVVDVLNDKVVAENARQFTYEFQTPDTAIFELSGGEGDR